MVADSQFRDGAGSQSRDTRPSPRYRFREGIWDVICEQMGWPNNFAASKALGVSDTTISRGLAGNPGERLMAAVMAALPRSWKFDHVFELATDDGSATFAVVSSIAIVLLLLLLLLLAGVGAS